VGVVNSCRRGRRESQVFVIVVVVVVVVVVVFFGGVRGFFQIKAERLRKSGAAPEDAAQPAVKRERKKLKRSDVSNLKICLL